MANTVNQPDGSSVTNTQPPSSAAAAPAAADPWTVEYEIDFTAESAHDFTGGVAVALTNNDQTVTWTPENEAGAPGTFEIEAGVGLRIVAPSLGKYWWNGTNTTPTLSAKIEDMMTGFSRADTVCLQLQVDSDPDVAGNYQQYGLGLWNGNKTDGYGFVLSRRTYEDAQRNGFLRNQTADHYNSATQFDFFEIVWLPCDGQILSAGVFSSSFPDPLATTTIRSYTNTLTGAAYGIGPAAAPTWSIPHDEGRFTILAQSWSSGTDMDVTAYKMRVLRRTNS